MYEKTHGSIKNDKNTNRDTILRLKSS